jgi:hypothetical protein
MYRYMISKVRFNLPALATSGATTTEVTGTLVGALRALTSRVGGSGKDRSSREPKSFNEHYKETYRTLLCVCNVPTAKAVAPSIWRRLANCTKCEQHTIMVQEFQCVRVYGMRIVPGVLCTRRHLGFETDDCWPATIRRSWYRRFDFQSLPTTHGGSIIRRCVMVSLP